MGGGNARINFRFLLFCALGIAVGIFLYGKIRFGGFALYDLLFPVLFLGFALVPFSWRRLLAVFLTVLCFAGFGALSLHIYTENFTDTLPDGEYRLAGRVISVSRHRGYSVLVLDGLSANGEEIGGKCRIILGDTSVCPADMLLLDVPLTSVGEDGISYDGFAQNLFSKDIRYTGRCTVFERTGRSKDPFLRLNGALFRCLYQELETDEASVAYALLTGSSGGMDEDLGDVARRGGIAHIFAVSGLHIGILYGAAYALFGFMKKYRFLPALFLAFLYAGVCGFTVSALRAVIMCGAIGTVRALGRKHDFLNSVSLAAIPVLLFLPGQWYAAGMKLSFGACLGLALFAGDLNRLFTRCKFPRFLREYLAANLSVQIFTFPILMEAFGYVSVWGTVCNFFLLPLLPVLFLGVLLFTLFSLVIPPAAGVLMLFPEGMLSAFLYVISVADLSLVITGFSLGAGSILWLAGCTGLSSRFRLAGRPRCLAAVVLAALFALTVVAENVVFTGARIDVYSRDGTTVALVRTDAESVLVVGEARIRDCEDFLRRVSGGRLDAVVVLSEDELAGINVACFLNADVVRHRDEIETGLQDTEVRFGEEFTVGGLAFRYESREKLLLLFGGRAVEFDFGHPPALGADLFIGGTGGRYRYYL